MARRHHILTSEVGAFTSILVDDRQICLSVLARYAAVPPIVLSHSDRAFTIRWFWFVVTQRKQMSSL